MFHSNTSSGNNTIDYLIARGQFFTLWFFLRLMTIYFRNSKTLEPRILKVTTDRNPNLLFIGYFFIMFLPSWVGLKYLTC